MPLYSQYDVPNSQELVNLGVGQPSTEDLPLEWFKNTLLNISNNLQTPEVLQYGAIPGYDKIRITLADWLTKKYYHNITKKLDVNHKINKNQLFMTNGNTGGLQLLINSNVEYGDEIIIEDPTYFIAKNIFEEYGCNINYVPMEKDGIDVEILEEKIKSIMKNDTKNVQKKIFLYTIPFHHNPTSINLSEEKKQKIAQLCLKYEKFYVISDEVYHFLSFNENEKLYPFADFHPKILSLGSFSKLVAPALRVGWIYQNTDSIFFDESCDILDKLKRSALLNSSGGVNPLGFLLIENIIQTNQIDDIIQVNIERLKGRCNLIMDFLTNNNLGDNVLKPEGGYFIWLKTKFEDTKKFLNFALKFRVKFYPGNLFGESCDNYIRLSFSYYKDEDLLIGLCRLLDAYNVFDKIKVSIYGSTGKLGSLIKNEIDKNEEFYFVDPITRVIKINYITDVIIDVTNDNATFNLIKHLLDKKINKPIIIGTTGLSNKTMNLIKLYSVNNPVGIISNFSEGISKIKKLIEEINKLDFDWKFSMIEKHHINKKDSPSGTAKTLANLLNRDCPIEAIREGEIFGYHQINAKSDSEEIVLSHNAKNRDIFAKGSLKYIKWILTKSSGIYYELDEKEEDYIIDKILGNKFLITENKKINISNIKKLDYDNIIIIEDLDKSKEENIIFTVLDKSGDIESLNGNDFLMVAKYLNKKYKLTKGKCETNVDKYTFKIDSSKIFMEIYSNPKNLNVKQEYSTNLTNIINQLSGLNIIGVSKYQLENKFLILEIQENLEEIDSDIITTLGSLINGDNDYDKLIDICFINIKEDNQIIMRYYDKVKGKETDGNVFGCVCVFDYLAYINDLSYHENLESTIIFNKEIIKAYYINEKFVISIQK